ncbi:MAG: hypothetical protein M5U35_13455 [Roseovarius sp.]|nr:hypothetical protein [Roseovarius sp.]
MKAGAAHHNPGMGWRKHADPAAWRVVSRPGTTSRRIAGHAAIANPRGTNRTPMTRRDRNLPVAAFRPSPCALCCGKK